ncbi:hypothetical protein A2U01_0074759, partial [Trifolium medium]|nr:hypothetical protein [Trifolium medium]
MPKPPTPKALVFLLRTLNNLVTRFTTLIAVTTTLLPSSATFTTLLVPASIGLGTVLPLPFVLVHGLIMIGFGPPILVTNSALI